MYFVSLQSMLKPTIRIEDKSFELSIPASDIAREVQQCAAHIEKDLTETEPLFIALLNGAFMFASDLMRHITRPAHLTFVKLASYEGDHSTGQVQELIGLTEKIEGRTVIIVEDIIDTGLTISELLRTLQRENPAEIRIAALLVKPESLQVPIHIDYPIFSIPNDFIVGYGTDYNGYGRNLPDIYTCINT